AGVADAARVLQRNCARRPPRGPSFPSPRLRGEAGERTQASEPGERLPSLVRYMSLNRRMPGFIPQASASYRRTSASRSAATASVQHAGFLIRSVHLAQVLLQIQADRAHLTHGRLLSLGRSPTTAFWFIDAVSRGRPPH